MTMQPFDDSGLDDELRAMLEDDPNNQRRPLDMNPDNFTHGPIPPRERSLEDFFTLSARNIANARRAGQRANYSRLVSRAVPDLLAFSMRYIYRRTADINTRTVVWRLLIEQGLDVLVNHPGIQTAREQSARNLAELGFERAFMRHHSARYNWQAAVWYVINGELKTISMTEEAEETVEDLMSELGLLKFRAVSLALMASIARSGEWIPAELCRVCHTEVESFLTGLATPPPAV